MIKNIEYKIEDSNDNFKDDSLHFEINNTNDKLHYSFINAIRRSIEENLESYVIDDIEVIENTSIFNNDILIHRLKLLPLMYEKVIENNPEEIKVTLDFTNKTSMPEVIKSSHISFKNSKGEISNLISYKDIIILNNIKSDVSVKFRAILKSGLSKEHAMYKHTFINKYYFKEDNKRIDEMIKEKNITNENEIKSFRLEQNVYKKNKNGNPDMYIYDIKSNGITSVKNSLKTSIDKLILKIKFIQSEIKIKSDTIFILPSENNPKIQVMTCINENNTIGNLFSYYCSSHKLLDNCSYLIPHPLKNELLIKFIFKKDSESNKDNSILIINEVSENLVKLLEEFKSFF